MAAGVGVEFVTESCHRSALYSGCLLPWLQLRLHPCLPSNRRFHFPAMNGDVGCGFDAETHLIAVNFDDGNYDLAVVDDDRFVAMAGKN